MEAENLEAIPHLIAYYDVTSDFRVQQAIIEALKSLDQDLRRYDVLAQIFRHAEEVSDREEAAAKLARLHDDRVIELFLGAADTNSPAEEREVCVLTVVYDFLVKRRIKAAVPLLLGQLSMDEYLSNDFLVSCFDWLVKIGAKKALKEKLKELLYHDDWETRQLAAIYFRHYRGDLATASYLIEAYHADDDTDVQQEIIVTLGRFCEGQTGALARLVMAFCLETEKFARDRIRIIETISGIGGSWAKRTLAARLGWDGCRFIEEDSSVRSRVVREYARLAGKGAAKVLLLYAAHEQDRSRQQEAVTTTRDQLTEKEWLGAILNLCRSDDDQEIAFGQFQLSEGVRHGIFGRDVAVNLIARRVVAKPGLRLSQEMVAFLEAAFQRGCEDNYLYQAILLLQAAEWRWRMKLVERLAKKRFGKTVKTTLIRLLEINEKSCGAWERDNDVRHLIVSTLRDRNVREATETLRQLVRYEDDPKVINLAVETMKGWGVVFETAELLNLLINGEDDQTKRYAVTMLARVGDETIVPTLFSTYENCGNCRLAERLIYLVGQFGTVDHLIKLKFVIETDRSKTVRSRAADAIVKIMDRKIAALEKRYNTVDPSS